MTLTTIAPIEFSGTLAETYLTQEAAASTYLTQETADTLYAPIAPEGDAYVLESVLNPQLDAINTNFTNIFDAIGA